MLAKSFLGAPIAHRALHDVTDGRPENSLAAIHAAVAAGYGIEIDVQRTADNQAVVFHDYDLARLTGQPGPIAAHSLAELADRRLLHGVDQPIPTLKQVLAAVAGRVPLLVEIKDQDGAMGANVGPLEAAVAEDIRTYHGPLAVMSFNPHSSAEMARLSPDTPRGLATCAWSDAGNAQMIKSSYRDHLREIADFDRVGATFISHEAADLARPVVQELRARGVAILCWTITSPDQEKRAREIAQNITFEGYLAKM